MKKELRDELRVRISALPPHRRVGAEHVPNHLSREDWLEMLADPQGGLNDEQVHFVIRKVCEWMTIRAVNGYNGSVSKADVDHSELLPRLLKGENVQQERKKNNLIPLVLSIPGNPDHGHYDRGPVAVACHGLGVSKVGGLPYALHINHISSRKLEVEEFYRRLSDVHRPQTINIEWIEGCEGTETWPKQVRTAVMMSIRNLMPLHGAADQAVATGIVIAFREYTMPDGQPEPAWR